MTETQQIGRMPWEFVVPLDGARDPSESLRPLFEIVNEDMGAINRIILDKAISDVEMIRISPII